MYFSFDTEAKEIVRNSISHMHKHEVNEYYIMVPEYSAIDSVGVLNRHNPIKVTNEHSLLFYSTEEKSLVEKNITDALKKPYDHFLIIGAPPTDLNNIIKIYDKDKDPVLVKLGYLEGFFLSCYLKHLANDTIVINATVYNYLIEHMDEWGRWFDVDFDFFRKTYSSSLMELKILKVHEESDYYTFLKAAIIDKKDYYSVANEIIFSSNYDFAIGMLEGFIATEKVITNSIGEILTLRNISVNVYTNLLTYLFSNFKMVKSNYRRYADDYVFAIDFTISPVVFSKLKLAHNKIKQQVWTWKIWGDGDMRIDKWGRSSIDSIAQDTSTLHKQLIELKEHDKIKFIRMDEMINKHIRTSEPESLYDITMGSGVASNYLIYGGPFAKNSDGDLLALFGVMSQEGIESAKNMLVSNINRLKNPLNPDKIDSWIQKDAVLGLYAGTK